MKKYINRLIIAAASILLGAGTAKAQDVLTIEGSVTNATVKWYKSATEPTATPTVKPTATPAAESTATPTVKPTTKPTATPTAKPTATPTAKPTAKPTTTTPHL